MSGVKPAVGVLGMGTMGRAMAGRIAGAGMATTVWSRRPPTAGSGQEVAADPAGAARSADVVITMVTDVDAVLEIAQDGGMLAALPHGAVWAQMSTIGVEGIEKVAALVAKERPDVLLVDAPVAGSKGPAEQGKLTVFAAGPDEAREKVTPVFDAVGQRTVWLGAAGQASRLKLVNNLLLAYAAQGLAESLAVAADLGLDRDTVLDAMDGSPLISGWQAQKMTRIREDDYRPEYALTLGLKDVKLALAAAPIDRLSVANAILGQWQRAVDGGLGDEDVTVVTRAISGTR
jgi:3-hydroxyisobutyrate dehydrogenase